MGLAKESKSRIASPGFGFVVEGTFPPAEKEYDYDDLERCFGEKSMER